MTFIKRCLNIPTSWFLISKFLFFKHYIVLFFEKVPKKLSIEDSQKSKFLKFLLMLFKEEHQQSGSKPVLESRDKSYDLP